MEKARENNVTEIRKIDSRI
jgi:hypothetical protein